MVNPFLWTSLETRVVLSCTGLQPTINNCLLCSHDDTDQISSTFNKGGFIGNYFLDCDRETKVQRAVNLVTGCKGHKGLESLNK